MSEPDAPLWVAVGVVLRPDSVLVCRRPAGKPMAGLWEFPGGKVEDGETVLEALARELREELGIEPTSAEPLFCVRHTYPEWEVVLDIWCVRSFRGEPAALEGQKVAWVPLTEVKTLEFPAANQPIVDWLSTLPRP